MFTVYGQATTLEALRKIKPERPERAGSRWTPIPHAELVEAVAGEVENRGWKILDSKFATARDGADLAGAFGLEIPNVPGLDGFTLGIGFVHSNAMRQALRITAGGTVACCTNGMCSGQLLLKRMHTGGVELVDEVDRALDAYTREVEVLPTLVAKLRETEVTPDQAAHTILRAADAKLVGAAAAMRVWAEYQKPTFAEHGKDNAWALLNAFTYAARKNINPVRQMETFNAFQNLLPVPAETVTQLAS